MISLAIGTAAAVNAAQANAQAIVASLIDAARKRDSSTFSRLAPRAIAWTRGQGHRMTFEDVYKCPSFSIAGGIADGPKVLLGEYGRSRPRALPAVGAIYTCGGQVSLVTFAIDGQKVVASELTAAFEGAP